PLTRLNSIQKYFQNTRKTAVVFRCYKHELINIHYEFFDVFCESFRSLAEHLRKGHLAGQPAQIVNLGLYPTLTVHFGNHIRYLTGVATGSVGAGNKGDHSALY